jgi:hypothetical protein
LKGFEVGTCVGNCVSVFKGVRKGGKMYLMRRRARRELVRGC